jgi:hypothetical protein
MAAKVKLSDLVGDVNAVTVRVGKRSFELTYHPLWESAWTAEQKQAIDDATGREFVMAFLAATVTKWDLTDDSGQPIPLTVDGMTAAELPDRLLILCQDAILEAEDRGKARGRG